MNTLSVIQHIARNPKYKKIVINDADKDETPDLTPMGAVGMLAEMEQESMLPYEWRLEGLLEKDTLLIYVQ